MASLESKKDTVLRLVKLGMSEERAYLAAEVDETEAAILTQDPFFVRRMKLVSATEELRLLEVFDKVMIESAGKGFSQDLKWKLSILNRERYGTTPADRSSGSSGDGKNTFKMNFNFREGTMSLEGADNVEVYRAPAGMEEAALEDLG